MLLSTLDPDAPLRETHGIGILRRLVQLHGHRLAMYAVPVLQDINEWDDETDKGINGCKFRHAGHEVAPSEND